MTRKKINEFRELVSAMLLQAFQSGDDRSPVSAGVHAWVEYYRDPPITAMKGYGELSVRASNILDIMKIRTPEDLGLLAEIDILSQGNAGPSTLAEIKNFALINGIQLAD